LQDLADHCSGALARLRGRDALRESEGRLRIVTENAGVGLVVVCRTRRYLYSNAAYSRMFKLPTDDLVGKRVADVLSTVYEEQIRPRLDRAFGGEHVSYELLRKTPDGEFHYAVSYEPAWFNDAVTNVVVVVVDITERKAAEKVIEESREQLRALLARLQKAQEEERIRVAREIHDELGQLLTGLKMDVRWLERKLAAPGLPPTLNPLLDRAVAASELADQTIAVVQKIAGDLRPGVLDRLGLVAALTQKARWFEERTGITCHVTASESGLSVSPEVATELFYICQEALTNVTRHAQATEVRVRFETVDDVATLEVADRTVFKKEVTNWF
jgi:PAS domain S-box-containing protein